MSKHYTTKVTSSSGQSLLHFLKMLYKTPKLIPEPDKKKLILTYIIHNTLLAAIGPFEYGGLAKLIYCQCAGHKKLYLTLPSPYVHLLGKAKVASKRTLGYGNWGNLNTASLAWLKAHK
ncbi:hypothetical protein CERSUDRAFT_76625 [Gelatoporia subvermispora B]|uniref:Uncharacterized protein n=1 Tax=Ceriporiopsis subvermispora (strain B) TaxID=914234 RepID=M2PCI0_CERS8|nr:hypothetical protein CERSUDRAFT_76625 [Gelatoporia subvermispora B]